MTDCATKPMMREPPGEPSVATSLSFSSKISVGVMDERGRLPGCTRFATAPFASSGAKEKSVSWLFRMNPATMSREPNARSTLVVNETALPRESTTERWLVEASSGDALSARSSSSEPGGTPGTASPIARSGPIKRARWPK